MATPKLTTQDLRFYIDNAVLTPAQIAQMFLLDLEEVEYRIARLRRDDKRRGRNPGQSPQDVARARRVAAALSSARRRPAPPNALVEPAGVRFEASAAVRDWMLATFILEGSALHNPVHQHLPYADIGVLWTNLENARAGRRIVGEACMPRGKGGKWAQGRNEYQLLQWFGSVPTFLITLDAVYASECGDWEFCALCEHELLHCGQAKDEFGAPRFNEETGVPIFSMRGHDIEGFVDIGRRYGPIETGVGDLVQALARGPEFGQAHIDGACGTCARKR